MLCVVCAANAQAVSTSNCSVGMPLRLSLQQGRGVTPGAAAMPSEPLPGEQDADCGAVGCVLRNSTHSTRKNCSAAASQSLPPPKLTVAPLVSAL